MALRHGKQFVKHVAPAVIKPVHILWNEVIGFIFLCMAALIGVRTAHGVAKHDAAVLVAFGFIGTLIMLWFGVSSFRKARKISRS